MDTPVSNCSLGMKQVDRTFTSSVFRGIPEIVSATRTLQARAASIPLAVHDSMMIEEGGSVNNSSYSLQPRSYARILFVAECWCGAVQEERSRCFDLACCCSSCGSLQTANTQLQLNILPSRMLLLLVVRRI